ncbi:hypothetical protein [Paenibacillus hamazuiensis]|uniref:hypothetical protein n=1 Tax=Paenibacillus hamazuiensis TaxID=2936508 RepID=UPI00200E0648|nr:hypothetical protein [Paenibacillus hamazuiensis]
MFDPTIYDNLKVVLEGALYDLDLAGQIAVTGRSDRLDLATMSRSFHMECSLREDGAASAGITLQAELADLAAEILERPEEGGKPGCYCFITFRTPVNEPQREAPEIADLIRETWGGRPQLKMTVSYSPDEADPDFMLLTSMHFGRKLDEGQAEDIQSLVDHVVLTLQTLDGRLKLEQG